MGLFALCSNFLDWNLFSAVKRLGRLKFVLPRWTLRLATAGWLWMKSVLATFWKVILENHIWANMDTFVTFHCRQLIEAPSPAVTRLAIDPRAGRLFVAAHTRTRTSQPRVNILYFKAPISSWFVCSGHNLYIHHGWQASEGSQVDWGKDWGCHWPHPGPNQAGSRVTVVIIHIYLSS